jgi:hypothetical protein
MNTHRNDIETVFGNIERFDPSICVQIGLCL